MSTSIENVDSGSFADAAEAVLVDVVVRLGVERSSESTRQLDGRRQCAGSRARQADHRGAAAAVTPLDADASPTLAHSAPASRR